VRRNGRRLLLPLAALALAVVIGVGAGAAIDTLRGGHEGKLSAAETARWIEAGRKGIKVSCRPGSGQWHNWDYACVVVGPDVPGTAADNTYGYDVDSKKVISFSG
jgi:hypothetical protein